MVISCILHRRVCVFVMVVFMCDACVFARDGVFYKIVVSKHIRTGIEAYTDGGFLWLLILLIT